ncbi:MAG: YhbY family RNA-binding protein [Nanoarchaeota archaeon]|nr:YhbY family RNA-binding protein [Nanoarchaeota archaeon]
MMEKESLKRLKSRGMLLKPTMQIGKNGLAEESIIEIKNQLKKNGLVKVKFLKAALAEASKKSLASQIEQKTESRLVSLVGFTAVYYKPIDKQTRGL